MKSFMRSTLATAGLVMATLATQAAAQVTFYEREKEDETFPPNLQRNLTDYFADGPQVEPFVLSAPPAFQDEEEE